MEDIIRVRQLLWAGHFASQHKHRLPRLTLYSELASGALSTGGQHKRFKDTLKASLKKFGLDPVAFENLSADRRIWRGVVNDGARHFGDCYRASAVARPARRHATSSVTM